MTKKQNW